MYDIFAFVVFMFADEDDMVYDLWVDWLLRNYACSLVMYTMAICSTAVRGVGISKSRQEIYGASQNKRLCSVFSYIFFKGLQRTHFDYQSPIAEICILLLFS